MHCALCIALAAFAASAETIAQLRQEADAAFGKKQDEVARDLALAVRTSTNATPADFIWAWRRTSASTP